MVRFPIRLGHYVDMRDGICLSIMRDHSDVLATHSQMRDSLKDDSYSCSSHITPINKLCA